MLRWHRLIAILVFPLLVYVVATGVGIQAWDISALVSRAPPTDSNMRLMRQHIYGIPSYVVVSAPDYVAPALPASLDYTSAIARTAQLGRTAMPDAPLRLVEVRGVAGKPAGHVRMGDKHLIFDLASGAMLPSSDLPPPDPALDARSPRSDFKFFHRFNYLGFSATWLNAIAGMALAGLMITGLIQYARLYAARRKQDRASPFWSIKQPWRDAHRWVSILAALPILWLAVTGFALSVDNLGVFVKFVVSGPPPAVNWTNGDFSSPMSNAELAGMTAATLRAFHAQEPGAGIKVLRLRYFAGYAQGVVIAADEATTQHVYNTRTGAAMSMTEKGYPDPYFPSGWEGHQWLKRAHRGDIFGLTGRWLDLLGGLGALFLMTSGAWTYVEMWRRRAKAGRRALVW